LIEGGGRERNANDSILGKGVRRERGLAPLLPPSPLFDWGGIQDKDLHLVQVSRSFGTSRETTIQDKRSVSLDVARSCWTRSLARRCREEEKAPLGQSTSPWVILRVEGYGCVMG
jgi:hypothetical protein